MKKPLILKINPQEPEIKKIQIAADIIKKGGLVAFPTETVYGLGADALNSRAVLSLFEAKNRPLDNPPIIHVENMKQVQELVKKVTYEAKMVMSEFWPGPLTLVFKRSDIVPNTTTAGLSTIAVRMPQHKVALALISESNCPIAAPSANLAGRPSATSAEHVFADLNGRIDAIVDGGTTQIGVESTVLDMSVTPPQILRPGGVSFESLKNSLDDLELHPFVVTRKKLPIDKVRSPGMRHKHYAPNAEVIVVEGEVQMIVCKVTELLRHYRFMGKKVGVLATDETIGLYGTAYAKSLGSRSNLDSIAKNLFRLLRDFEIEGVETIIAEGVSAKGIGLAIMNRLRKASGYNIVKAE
ncbi:threonylcarbamoyl-AMP synthase [Candidatus Bathyarchaeota archaeon]|nr:threonylcarbamoyl-AMP synthase [Candidatus Bathyarchaeota archaeon]